MLLTTKNNKFNYPLIVIEGEVVGILSGLVSGVCVHKLSSISNFIHNF
jgi:hypothetical protein